MRPAPLLVALLLAGCDALTSGASGHLRTSADAYVATVGETWISFEVPVTLRNTGGETLLLTGCSRPNPPAVEKRVAGEWMPAFYALIPLCLAEPVPVAPGATLRYTLEATAAHPGRGSPEWRVGEVPGTYRLRWPAGTESGGVDLMSNPFELTVR